MFAPLPAAAQDTSRTVTMDSLVARLKALESSVDVLQKQLADQATTAVQTRSRLQLDLTGRIVMNAFSNDRGVNNADDPQFVRRDTASSLPSHGFGMAVRQTLLGLRTNVSDVAGGSFLGVVDMDFYGGQQPSTGGRTFPLLRIRTAHGTLHWDHAEIMAGQEIPLFSPQNPISPAAFGTPDFVGAGNLWLWLPQLRLTGEVGSTVRLALQGAVLAPTSGDAVGAFDTDFDAAERTRRPYLESRLRLRWGEDPTQMSEIGCAAHVGWVSVPAAPGAAPDSMLTSHGFGCDARVSLADWLELRGEGYTGQLMRGLGGGGIGQGVGRLGVPIRDNAVWAQLNVRPIPEWSFGVGGGIDAPDSTDVYDPVNVNARLRNTAYAAYTIVRPAGPTFIGAEVRYISTKYSSGTFANTHINLAFGFEF
ncbi:MAG: hypothetical protein ACREPM_07200 [Gemmatimonadaceae bacterium]